VEMAVLARIAGGVDREGGRPPHAHGQHDARLMGHGIGYAPAALLSLRAEVQTLLPGV